MALLFQVVEEYLEWLELGRHASAGTIEGNHGALRRFSEFAGGDFGISNIVG